MPIVLQAKKLHLNNNTPGRNQIQCGTFETSDADPGLAIRWQMHLHSSSLNRHTVNIWTQSHPKQYKVLHLNAPKSIYDESTMRFPHLSTTVSGRRPSVPTSIRNSLSAQAARTLVPNAIEESHQCTDLIYQPSAVARVIKCKLDGGHRKRCIARSSTSTRSLSPWLVFIGVRRSQEYKMSVTQGDHKTIQCHIRSAGTYVMPPYIIRADVIKGSSGSMHWFNSENHTLLHIGYYSSILLNCQQIQLLMRASMSNLQ